MAANLSSESGKVEMAYAIPEGKPWHGLGTAVPGLMTTAEALQAAHLDWGVEKVKVYTDAEMREVEGFYAVIRSDTKTPLGIVKERYMPISNREAFKFFDHALSEAHGQIDTAGALGKGERVWMMAKMPDNFSPLKGDTIEKYLLVTTTHDGTGSLEIMFTGVRTVCQNTLSVALSSATNRISIRHTKSSEENIKQAAMALKQSDIFWKELKELCAELSATSVTRVEVGAFLDAMFPTRIYEDKEGNKTEIENKDREMAEWLIENGRGTDIPGVYGSAWGLFNAATEWYDHHRSVKGSTSRWERSVFGNGYSFREKALQTLQEVVA